ncbi:pyroglutamyl-peptidase 1-like protein isoform X2 [Chrysemys picta bellii]|uniref:pyroglutamyl-peptidase 1-like protein isoform X2 n=1 Tax=Chrysemys picta bellii TaxID=8478 RepID=UPI0032B13B0C
MDSNSNTVVVTGFGPFRQHLINSSWEAVKEMSKLGLGENIDLHIMQLPVSYQKAKELVCKIWGTLQPLTNTLKYTSIFHSLDWTGHRHEVGCHCCPQSISAHILLGNLSNGFTFTLNNKRGDRTAIGTGEESRNWTLWDFFKGKIWEQPKSRPNPHIWYHINTTSVTMTADRYISTEA